MSDIVVDTKKKNKTKNMTEEKKVETGGARGPSDLSGCDERVTAIFVLLYSANIHKWDIFKKLI